MCWCGYNKPNVVGKGETVKVLKIVAIDGNGFQPYFFRKCDINRYGEGNTYIEKEFCKGKVIFPCSYGEADRVVISTAIHSYLEDGVNIDSNICGYEEKCLIRNIRNGKDIQGYISCKNLPVYNRRLAILKGHLPEGATYFINENDEIASDRITVDSIKPLSEMA